MKITIYCVGRTLPKHLQVVVDEYEHRLRPFAQLEWSVIKPSSKSADQACEQESHIILERVSDSDTVILLDERGSLQTNEQFAGTFRELSARQGKLVFVIGGAYGVNGALRKRADFVWSLSPLVFPHQLVRVILSEQLYRTFMLLQGHPYHHS